MNTAAKTPRKYACCCFCQRHMILLWFCEWTVLLDCIRILATGWPDTRGPQKQFYLFPEELLIKKPGQVTAQVIKMLHRTSKKLNCSRSRDALLVLTGVRRHPSSVYKSSSVTGGPLEETSTTELRGSRSRFAYPEGIKDFEDDWTEHAEYPTIDVETHKWSVERRERHQLVLNWRKEIRDASCPEAKYLKINKWYELKLLWWSENVVNTLVAEIALRMEDNEAVSMYLECLKELWLTSWNICFFLHFIRKFGYKVFQVSEDLFDYNSLQAYKYITRTHVASDHQLPSHYSSPGLTEKVEYFKEKVKEPLLDALAFELDVP